MLDRNIGGHGSHICKSLFFRKEIMTEELFWQRVSNLWKIMNSITDDLVYKAMWERKLKELMQKGFK